MINFAGAVTRSCGDGLADASTNMPKGFRGEVRTLSQGTARLVWSGDGSGEVGRHDASGLIVAVQGRPWLDDAGLAGRAASRGLVDALAEGYRIYGDDVLGRVKGDFAFAVVDPNAPRVLVATDRFAARRMHVAETEGQILFGTVLDPIKSANPVFSRVSAEALYRYLYFYAIPAPYTVYEGIRRLEPGYACRWTPGGATTARYWAPEFGPRSPYAFETARDNFLQALETSVARACGDNSRVGAFLSGGLDSSAVAGMMARQGAHPCFHVSFDSASFDESAYAKRAADWFGLPLEDVRLTPTDAFDILSDLTRHFDEPFGNSSAIPATLCARRAQELGVTTMLAGDGGDEIFGGNERYVRQKKIVAWQKRIPAWLRHLLAGVPRPLRRGIVHRLARVSELASYSVGKRILEGSAVLNADPADVLSPDLAQAVRAHGPVDDLETYARETPSQDWLYQLLYVDMKYTLADNDLRKVGAACELAGVDVAYPMLDETVVDLALSIPIDELIRGFRLRHFYKEAVSGFLPEEIVTKTKQGFGMPFANWLVDEPSFRRLADDALSSLAKRRLLAPGYLEGMRAAIAGRGDRRSVGAAWDLVVLELWLAEHAADLPV
jgi:asparagine synthase (glutamine-hydrolysing)